MDGQFLVGFGDSPVADPVRTGQCTTCISEKGDALFLINCREEFSFAVEVHGQDNRIIQVKCPVDLLMGIDLFEDTGFDLVPWKVLPDPPGQIVVGADDRVPFSLIFFEERDVVLVFLPGNQVVGAGDTYPNLILMTSMLYQLRRAVWSERAFRCTGWMAPGNQTHCPPASMGWWRNWTAGIPGWGFVPFFPGPKW